MEYKFIKTIEKKDTAIIQMCNPDDKNILTLDGMNEIFDAMNNYESNKEFKFLVLTGSEDCFCFGGRLGNRFEMTSEDILVFANTLVTLHKRLRHSRLYTIAAVNGLCGGGGFSVMEACDFAVCSDNATFEFPEIHSGLAPMLSIAAVTEILPKKVCLEMFAFAKVLSAKEALNYGMVNKIVSTDVLDATLEFIAPLAAQNEFALGLCKDFYLQCEDMDYAKRMEMGKHYLMSMVKSAKR